MAEIKWKTDIGWIDRVFDKSWRLRDKEGFVGIDINRDNVLQPTERVDRDKDNFVSIQEWALFLKQNQKHLSRFKEFRPYFNSGQGFSLDNPIHDLLSIEAEVVDEKTIDNAYRQAAYVLEAVRNRLDNPGNNSAEGKLRTVYSVIDDRGITYSPSLLFSPALKKQHLDCDTSSFMVISVAHELGWPVTMVNVPRHAFVRWNDGKGTVFNMDFGMQHKDDIYKEKMFTTNPVLDTKSVDGKGFLKDMSREQLVASFLTNVGLALLQNNKPFRAGDIVEKALELDPDSPYAHIIMAHVLISKQDAYGALQHMDHALELSQYQPHVHRLKARVLYSLSRYEEAKSSIKIAMILDPRNVSDYMIHAHCEWELKQPRKAIGDLNKAIDIEPSQADLYQLRGTWKMEIGDYYGSVRDFNVALDLEPGYVGWLTALRDEAMRKAAEKVVVPKGGSGNKEPKASSGRSRQRGVTIISW